MQYYAIQPAASDFRDFSVKYALTVTTGVYNIEIIMICLPLIKQVTFTQAQYV